jgi:hypothetical protein
MKRRDFISIVSVGSSAAALGASPISSISRVAVHCEDPFIPLNLQSCLDIPGLEELTLSPGMSLSPAVLADRETGPKVFREVNRLAFLRSLQSYDLTVTGGETGGDEDTLPALIAASRRLLVIGPVSLQRASELLDLARRFGTPLSVALPDPSWQAAAAPSGPGAQILVDLGAGMAAGGSRAWNFACFRALHGACHVLVRSMPDVEFLGATVLHVPARHRGTHPGIHHVASLRFADGQRFVRLGSMGANLAGASREGAARSGVNGTHFDWNAAAPLDLAKALPGSVALYDRYRSCASALLAERVLACCIDSMLGGGREVSATRPCVLG